MSDAATIAAPADTAAAPAAPAPVPSALAPAAAQSWVDAPTEIKPADAAAPAPDATKDGDQAADPGAQAPAEDKPAERAAPEAYELKAPEGVTLDTELVAEFEGMARELSMPQAEAQALVERMAPKIQARMQAAQVELLAQARAEWSNQVEADPEIGGAGKAQVLATAGKALQTFGSDALRALLKDSGIEAHPEVIRFFYRAGKSVSEESFIGGRASSTSSAAQSIYSASNMNP